MSETKSAAELAASKLESGDTTNVSVTVPGMSGAQTLEAQQTQEQQKRFESARETAIAEHDAGAANPTSMHRLYKSSMDTSFIFKDGSIAVFKRKRYLTNNPAEIAQLDYEIKTKRNPYLMIDPNEIEADPALETPEAKMRAQLFAEWSGQMMRALNPKQDAGSTEIQKLTPQSSTGIQDVAVGGAPSSNLSGQMQSLLARIKSGK